MTFLSYPDQWKRDEPRNILNRAFASLYAKYASVQRPKLSRFTIMRAPQEPYGAVGPLGGTARHASESGYNESYNRSRLGPLGADE